MAMQVIDGAVLKCSFGMAPSILAVVPMNMVKCGQKPAANIMDHVPMLNIKPFGMCQSMANPQVIAATSAALGVLTPQPCVPATTAPWTPGAPGVLLAHQPTLDDSSMCMCMWAGVVTITQAGQTTTTVP